MKDVVSGGVEMARMVEVEDLVGAEFMTMIKGSKNDVRMSRCGHS